MPERKIEYQHVSHLKQSFLRVEAPSWQRLYIDTGLALVDSFFQIERIHDNTRQVVQVSGNTMPQLMQAWLNGLVSSMIANRFVPKRIVFDKFDGKSLQATLWGEVYEPTRHGAWTLNERPLESTDIKLADSSNGFSAEIATAKLR